MKKNLRLLLIFLAIAILALVLSLLNPKWHLLFLLITTFFILLSYLPLKRLFDWEKQFQVLGTGKFVNPDSFFPKSQEDLKDTFTQFEAMQNKLESCHEEHTRLSGNLEALISHLTMGMLLVNKEKEIVIYSKSLPNYFPEAGQLFERIEDIGRTDIKAAVSQAFDTRLTVKKELKGFHDGDLILEVTAIPISNQAGEIEQVLVLLYDLTTIRAYEKLNMDFVSNASHELRTPVTSIKGFAETIKNMPEDEKELKAEFLDIIYNESLRLEHIVEHMLTLSRVKKTQLQKTHFSVNEFLRYIGNSMKHQLDQKQLQLDFALDQDLTIESDKYLLSQILLNLMSNAIRYTDEGGTITISSHFDGHHLGISVKDTGIGISQIELDRIFERFYRVNKGRSRQSGGTGLGLSIVKELSQILGGEVTVQSRLGKGSQFTLTLPSHLIREMTEKQENKN